MHFKRKVIVFSSSWRFLLNLSSDNKYGEGKWKGCRCVYVNETGRKMFVSRGDNDEEEEEGPGGVEVYACKT